MTMKKIPAVLIALLMIFSLAACSGGYTDNGSDQNGSAGETNQVTETMKFPDFSGKDLDGNDVDSSLFTENTVTVVNFWFSECEPCINELAELSALNKELQEKGGEVIGINTYTLGGDEKMIEEAKSLLAAKNADYRNIRFDLSGDAGIFVSGVTLYPCSFVVDRNGDIVGEPILGGIDNQGVKDALMSQIDRALASGAGE